MMPVRKSSEALGRWNGKAWMVNIWTRRVVRRCEQELVRGPIDVAFATNKAEMLKGWTKDNSDAVIEAVRNAKLPDTIFVSGRRN